MIMIVCMKSQAIRNIIDLRVWELQVIVYFSL